MSHESYWDWLPKEIQEDIVKWSYYPDEKRIALNLEIRDSVQSYPQYWNHWGNGFGVFRLIHKKRGRMYMYRYGYKDWYWAFTGCTIDGARERKKTESYF